MATHARQQYFADENSLSKERREFSIADEIQEKIDSVEEGAQVNKIETVKVNGTALVPDTAKAVNVEVPDVIDNLYTVAADDALSAKQGKILYDYIQNIASRGRFLSNWNCATGLPVTNPTENPYPYKAGDYYSVSNVASGGGTNYRPDGSLYIIGQASTTVETEEVSVSDFYLYDGTNWLLLVNTARQIAVDSSLSTTSTNPVENRVVTNAINGKQNTLTAGNHIAISSDVISTTGLQDELTAGNNITIATATESDMKGPCPSGYHVPSVGDWANVIDILVYAFGLASNDSTPKTYLKMPVAGWRSNTSSSVSSQGSRGWYWSSSNSGSSGESYNTRFTSILFANYYSSSRASGYSIRPFKNAPVVPDSSWTTLYDGSSIAVGAGVFHNATDGLISLSSNGTTWITIADKNLGATVVYNDGDTLSEANCGGYFQWGNNYMFPFTGDVTTSSTQVDASAYGPGNYYSSSTFILSSGGWDTTDNTTLRGVGGTFTSGTVISATDTTYTAGAGISIDANNEISNTQPGATVSSTAPSNPSEGDLWYDTANDELKTYNGTAWQTEGTKMVVLQYGVSTWQDFIDAYNENAIVYCKVSSGSSGYRMAFMAYTAGQGTPTEVEFQYYRSRSSHSQSSTQLDEVYVYKLTNAGVWTTTQRDTGAEMIAGTGIGITFNSSGATISNSGVTSVNGNTGTVTVEEVPSGGTEGQVLTQTNNGPAWQNPTGGADIVYATQAEYNALLPGAESDGKHYFIYRESQTAKLIEFLMVGGGGAGGNWDGGGGGAGGVIHQTDYDILSGTYPISIGAGGIGYAGDDNGTIIQPANSKGGDTTFLGLTAYGGGTGGGRRNTADGLSGGCGGGGGGWGSISGIGGSGTNGQGYAGGDGLNAPGMAGQGGGGGAGGVGTTANGDGGFNGGDGIVNPITGSTAGELINGEYWIAGGGGGGIGAGSSAGVGGKGGGGAGSSAIGVDGADGSTYGAGGGGGSRDDNSAVSGSGYQGIVIIKYKTGDLTATGGTVTTSGNYTIHTFTSDGNFVVS